MPEVQTRHFRLKGLRLLNSAPVLDVQLAHCTMLNNNDEIMDSYVLLS